MYLYFVVTYGRSLWTFAFVFSLFDVLLLCLDVRLWDHLVRKKELGPVVQSAVSLTSSLVVKMLTALVSTIPKFFQKKKCKSYSHFSAKILAYVPYLVIKILTIR